MPDTRGINGTRLWLHRDIPNGYWLNILYIALKEHLFPGRLDTTDFLESNLNVLAFRMRAFPSLGFIFFICEMVWCLGLVFRLGSRVPSRGDCWWWDSGPHFKQRGPSLSGLLIGIHSTFFVCRKDFWKMDFAAKKEKKGWKQLT